MLAKQMLDFRKSLYKEGVVFCYSGYMTEDVLLSIGTVIKQKLAADAVGKKIARGVFSVFVEQVQNIIRYSIEEDAGGQQEDKEIELRYGILMMGFNDDKYFVSCGNLVKLDNVDSLRTGLSHIQKLDREGLKALYKEILRGETPEGSKGAGAGFIVIAKRATNGFEFDFTDYDNEFAFFSLKAYI